MTKVIELFLDSYSREYDFYREAARLAHDDLINLLREQGIRARVTFRAKTIESLREKLFQREEEKKYKTQEDIRSDIADLSGVRIELYFPDDRSSVGKIIADNFSIVHSREYPLDQKRNTSQAPIEKNDQTGATPYKKQFSGYKATHFRVKLNKEIHQSYSFSTIEIQLASVLMHSWSEVEHDFLYKPTSGNISLEEEQILDELNGLVLTGEIALSRLQKAYEARILKPKSKLTNHYELAVFLHDEIKRIIGSDTITDNQIGNVSELFTVLQISNKDNKEEISNIIKKIFDGSRNEPLSQMITDEIFSSDPKSAAAFVKSRKQEKMSSRNLDSIHARLEFLEKWTLLETAMKIYLLGKGTPYNGSFMSEKKLTDMGFSEGNSIFIQYCKAMRDKILQQKQHISSESIINAATNIAILIQEIKNSPNAEWADAMKQAIKATEKNRSSYTL